LSFLSPERTDDLPALVQHVLARATGEHGKTVSGVTPDAFECLTRYPWPGNVRELQNELGRAVALVEPGGVIEPRHLSAKLRDGGTAEPGGGKQAHDLRDARAAFERRHILDVLRQHDGNITRAAQALGLSRFMLQRKLKEYGLR
jgi:two-component system response regulator HupR/HoxA